METTATHLPQPTRPKLDLLLYPSSVLTTPCKPITIIDVPHMTVLFEEIVKVLTRYGGVGLAANQIGFDTRFLVMQLNGEWRLLVNPEIVKVLNNDVVATMEGCLSLPGVTAKLHCRKKALRIKAHVIDNPDNPVLEADLDYDVAGHTQQEVVIFQHELDHLDGKTLFDRMGSAQKTLKKNQYLKKVKKYKELLKHSKVNPNFVNDAKDV